MLLLAAFGKWSWKKLEVEFLLSPAKYIKELGDGNLEVKDRIGIFEQSAWFIFFYTSNNVIVR